MVERVVGYTVDSSCKMRGILCKWMGDYGGVRSLGQNAQYIGRMDCRLDGRVCN